MRTDLSVERRGDGARSGARRASARWRRACSRSRSRRSSATSSTSRRWACSRWRRPSSSWRSCPRSSASRRAPSATSRWAPPRATSAAARGSAQAALLAGLVLSTRGRGGALLPRARDLRALPQARGDAPAAARLAGAAAAVHEPRVRRLRARLRPHRALLHDHRRAERHAPARDGAARAAAGRRDGARTRASRSQGWPARCSRSGCCAASPRGSWSPRATAGTLRSMIGFSWPQTLSQSLYLATLWTDTLVLAHYGTARQVGIYGLVVALLAPVSQLTVAVSQAFTPRIAGTHARGDSAGLAQMLQRVSYWNLAVALPILGSMAVLREPLLALFGARLRGRRDAARAARDRAARAQRGRAADRRDQPLGPPARDALRQRARVRREPRALRHPRAALRHGRRGDLHPDRALQRDAAAGRAGRAAVPHPPLPRRPAALPRGRRRWRRSRRPRSRCCRGPRRCSRSSSAASSSSPSTRRASPSWAFARRRENCSNVLASASPAPGPDLIERMGGWAS